MASDTLTTLVPHGKIQEFNPWYKSLSNSFSPYQTSMNIKLITEHYILMKHHLRSLEHKH